MSKKLEVLKYMREKVATDGCVKSHYVVQGGETCSYCVIGHGLKKLGFSDDQLLVFDVFSGSTEIESIMIGDEHYLNTTEKLDVSEKIRDKLFDVGFTIEELTELQLCNDSYDRDSESSLINLLDKYIEKESKNEG